MSLNRICAAALVAVGLFAAAAPARAAIVSWDIDSAQSFVRLTIPDQNITFEGVAVNVRVRDQGSNSNWTDNGGRRAFVDGTLETNVLGGVNPTALTFISGSNTILGIDDKNLRPNPAAWNGTNFTNTTTAPAAFGGKIRGSALGGLVQFDAAFFSISDVIFDIVGGGPVVGNAVTGGSTFGINDGVFGADGQTLPLNLGEIPDLLEDAPPLGGANTGSITLTNVGGDNWRINYNINVPVSLVLEDVGTVTGTAAGQIVAFATLVVPEPSSVFMAGVAALGLCWAGRRRFRRA